MIKRTIYIGNEAALSLKQNPNAFENQRIEDGIKTVMVI